MRDKNRSLTPHDAFFKRALQDIPTARQLLERHLPAETLALLRLETLEYCKIDYVDKDLQKSASDVVLKVKTTRNDDAYVYLLIEQQRNPEKALPFRVLRYLVRIMEDHLRQYQTQTLPLVIPLIIYNGDNPYPYSTDLFDLFPPEQQAQARHTLFAPYPLLDLTQEKTEDIIHNPGLALLLNALKYGPKKISPEVVVKVLEMAIIELAGGEDLLMIHTTLHYLYEVRSKEDRDALWQGFQTRLKPILGEKFMISIADELRYEGRQEGIQAGMQAGMQLREMQIAKNLLNSGLDLNVVAKSTGLDIAVLKALQEETKH